MSKNTIKFPPYKHQHNPIEIVLLFEKHRTGDSSVSIQAGRPGFNSRHSVQTVFGAHPAYPIDIGGPFPVDKAAEA